MFIYFSFLSLYNCFYPMTKLLYALGYTYAGVQAVTKCFCGSHYEMYIPLRDSSCGMVCSGDFHQNCGGEFARSLYSTAPLGRHLSVIYFCNISTFKIYQRFIIYSRLIESSITFIPGTYLSNRCTHHANSLAYSGSVVFELNAQFNKQSMYLERKRVIAKYR